MSRPIPRGRLLFASVSVVIVVCGSVYGANLKMGNEVQQFKQEYTQQDAAQKAARLLDYRRQLTLERSRVEEDLQKVEQRLVQERIVAEMKAAERRAEQAAEKS
ncbi:hypothetical protein SAICODRAFT_16257 [Saitoella complicata NRRL Y-17804]|nr:uncharacterized protein SAICODRAFT_16257 [Saitoella complicata NRRL Y-17804]ODQ56236.1 hypothetical protein SAICODRAFT_16257 [Saitoella complicata NRRL Y-17804]